MLAVRTPGAPLATRTLSRPAIPPSPLRDRVGYSDHDRFRGYFPVHFIPAYNLPVYASQWPSRDTTQDSLRGCSLVLLCHKFCRCLRDDRRMQHWHRCKVIAIATANKRWMVAIELGTCRCGRIGGAAGSVTAGKGRFFDCSGAMRC